MNSIVVLVTVSEDGIMTTTHLNVSEAEKCLVENFGDEDDTTDTIYDSMEFNHPYVMFSITEHKIA